MNQKEAKKLALKELERLRKDLKEVHPDLASLRNHLSQLPLFDRFTYESKENGVLKVHYAHMTLTFYVKSGSIILDKSFDLWNDSGIGFIGTFTDTTLKMECEDGLD